MKKNVIILTLTLIGFFACEESVNYNSPDPLTDNKTVNVIIDNVPEAYIGEDIYLFIISNESTFSTEQGVAIDDTIITLLPPAGHSEFDIVAYIPSSSSWEPGDNYSSGYYSIVSTTERESYFTTVSWDYSTVLPSSGSASTTVLAQLYIYDEFYDINYEFDQGDIIYIEASAVPYFNSPIADVKYYLDNSEIISYSEKPYDYALNTLDLDAGEHIIKVIATNEAGHRAEDEEEIIINSNENEAPTIHILYLENGEVITHGNTQVIEVLPEDPEGNIDRVVFKINNNTVETLTEGPWEYAWETINSDLGVNTITVTVFDDQEASRSDVINVTLEEPDNYKPQITITNPYEGQIFNQGDYINIETSASDVENDIAYVIISIDGSTETILYDYPYNYTYYSGSLTAADHTIGAKVFDGEGLSDYEEITITIQ